MIPSPDRAPAPAGLAASENWSLTSAALAVRVRQALGLLASDEAIVECAGGSAVPRFFRVSLPGETIFVKVVPQSEVETELAANAIARAVSSAGVEAVCLCDKDPRVWEPESCLLVYPWVATRVVPLTATDMARLGQAVGGLHRALRCLPSETVDEVTRRSAERVGWMRARNGDLGAFAGRLRELSKDWAADLVLGWVNHPWDSLRTLSRQVVHGDLNAGNVLADESRGVLVFFDFEESTRQLLPPVVDLAMAFERQVLSRAETAAEVSECLEAFMQGYAESEGEGRTAEAATHFRAGLRWNLLIPMTIMAEMGPVAADWTVSEWEKFCRLADLHQRYDEAMEAVLRRWRR